MNVTPSNIVRSLSVGFLIGTVLLSWGLNLSGGVQWVWMAGMMTVLILAFLFVRAWIHRMILLLVIAQIVTGALWYIRTFPTDLSIAGLVKTEVMIEGTVRDVEVSNGWQKIVLSDLAVDNQLLEDRVQIIALTHPEFEYGDVVRAECELEAPGQIEDFAYDRFLAAKGIYATCFSYDVWLQDQESTSWKTVMLDAREMFIDQLDRVFGEPHGSLLVGLLLGEQRFTQEWEERFLKTGTTHIVAASGYNISVVLWLAMGFFATLGIKRQKAFAFLAAAVCGYILLAGADAAVFRAGVMGIVLLLANQTERRTSMVNVLLITATVMLVINPRLLRDDVGFQLSMMSTIGLIYLSPIIKTRLRWVPKVFVIQESIVATLSATFMSLPVLFLQFESFSFVSFITNVFVLPWIPLAMASGAIATCISFVSVLLAAVIAAPAWLALTIMLWCVQTFAALNLYVQSIHWTAVMGLLSAWTFIILRLWFFKENRFLLGVR